MRKVGIALLVLGGLAVFWHFISPNIFDLDSFFYMGKAHLIREVGLSDNSFPWMQFSVIKETGSSLWFGFGLFLLPFSFLADPILGIKLAGVLLTTFALFSCFWVARRHQLKWPLFWPILMLFSAPNVTSQLLMTRPQTLTIGLGILLLSFLVEGRLWQIFLATFFLVWIHLNFAWMPVAIAGLVLISRLMLEKKLELWKYLALLAGLLAGWIARPNPLGAAKLFYIQVIKQVLEKQSGLPLLFGTENFPLTGGTLFGNFWVFLLIWVIALILLGWWLWNGSLRQNKTNRILSISAAGLSVIFFLLSIIVARRAYDFWIAFGILLIALATSTIMEMQARNHQNGSKEWTWGFLIVALCFLVLYSGGKTIKSYASAGYHPDYAKAAGEWLVANTNPGDLVFNLHWTHFSPLFLWDRKNYYLNGLDPIFQYNYDPSLYWKFHYLSANLTIDKTCGKPECRNSDLLDTYSVLKNDFKAKYILVGKKFNPQLDQYLSTSPNFEKVFEAVNEVIYRIK